jgi:type I restriction enzyme, S subunit
MIKLKDAFKLSKGRKAEVSGTDSGLRYIQIEDLRNNDSLKYAVPDSKNVLCQSNDILIAWDGANAGTVGYGLSGVVGSTLAKLTPKNEKVFIPYAGKFLQSKFKYLRDNCTGATIPHISRPTLDNLQIPLPPLPVQQKIAAILDAADMHRQKTKTLIEKYDQLTQSIFLEMFGEILNTSENVSTLEDICGKGVYGSGASAIAYYEHSPRYLRITDINDDGSLKNEKVAPSEIHKDYLLKERDLVFARSGATVGKTYLYKNSDGVLLFAGYLIKFTIPEPHNPSYFFHFTKTEKYRSWIKNKQNVVAQPNINAKQYGQELLIPIPPIALQNKFAERVQIIESQKKSAYSSLEKAEDLFNTLLQRAFKGELVN